MPATAIPTSELLSNAEGDGGECIPQNGREARNLAEKQRRDKLNAYIQELATMVPHVAESTRRLDKTAVLRFAAHGLRLQYVFGKSTAKKHKNNNCRLGKEHLRENLEQPHFTDTLLQLLDSFFVALTCHGQIVVISASVEQLLGHCQSDLYGQNILHITHPEDQLMLLQQLIPRDLETLFQSVNHDMMDETEEHFDQQHSVGDCFQHRSSSPRNKAQLDEIDRKLQDDRRCFTVRLARAGTRSEASRSYEIVKLNGCFRRSDYSNSAGSFPIVSQLIRRSRSTSSSSSSGSSGLYGHLNTLQHDAIAQAALHGISGNDIILVAMARIIRPPKILNLKLGEANLLEYKTRHLIDGRIIDCDQRIGLVAGYMKDEVRNLSPFSFMHQDDVRWVIVALRQMYDCSSDYGESCYRLLSRNGHFIYLHTKGFLEIDKSTNKVYSFVCVNTLLSEEEGRRRVQEMKNKFSVIIKTKIPSNSLEDVPASQNPQQLERIVLYLIDNLQKRHDQVDSGNMCDDRLNEIHGNNDNMPTITAPPLALVPPEPSSVKSSISQSVNVVNVTAAKNLQINNLNSPLSHRSNGSEASLSPASSIDHTEESMLIDEPNILQAVRPSVLHMRTATTQTPTIISPKHKESTSPRPTSKKIQQQMSVLKRLHVSEDGISPAKRCSSSIIAAPLKLSAKSLLRGMSSTAPTTAFRTVEMQTVPVGQRLDESVNLMEDNENLLCNLLPRTPKHLVNEMDDLVDGQQKQQAIVVNIKSEYEVHHNASTSLLLKRLCQPPVQPTQASKRDILINRTSSIISSPATQMTAATNNGVIREGVNKRV